MSGTRCGRNNFCVAAVFVSSLVCSWLLLALSTHHRTTLDTIDAGVGEQTDVRPLAVVHVGPHKCASSLLQAWIYLKMRDYLEMDGFALPSDGDIQTAPARVRGAKVVANFADMLQGKIEATDVNRFLHRASNQSKRLLLSTEEFDWPDTKILTLKAWLTPWRVHVVVIYRPFHQWVKSYHWQINRFRYGQPKYEPLVEFASLKKLLFFSSSSSQFSIACRDRYVAAGFNVTVLQLNSSLLLDFFCGVVGAHHTCRQVRQMTTLTTKKQGPSVLQSCDTDVCLGPDELSLLLILSVELDRAMPADVQFREPFIREDFSANQNSSYFCSCGRVASKQQN